MRVEIIRPRTRRRNKSKRDARNRLHKDLIKLWKVCIQAFIKETSRSIHVDSGMSMASLLPIAAKVRISKEVEGKLTSAVFKRNIYFSSNYPGLGKYKSKAHGKRLGTQNLDLIEYGTPSNMTMKFGFDIVVLQHAIHDASWKSLENGKRAFIQAWTEGIQHIVKASEINNWLITGEG